MQGKNPQRVLIKIKGVVQGVGFRPFVYRLASTLGLRGYVMNTGGGVLIEAEGEGLEALPEKIRAGAPPLSEIREILIEPLERFGYGDFRILESIDKEGRMSPVSPDISICGDCLREMEDPSDRRYRYPFINCTNCGPRYSITKSIPYDRARTTMSAFTMCPGCRREYGDPRDRRFHAEPNACPECGPSVSFEDAVGALTGDLAIEAALSRLKEGSIIAIKGLGGFHLACDALNDGAVRELRKRKRNNGNKPFALMAGDADTVRKYCHVSAEEEALLSSARRPVVLLNKKKGAGIPEAVAPGNSRIGFMLPYTPLHRLFFNRAPGLEAPGFEARGVETRGLESRRVESRRIEIRRLESLVMTSGNISEEPIVIDNAEARKTLSRFADAFLFHDREIHTRVDDSVSVLSERHKFQILIRRARGYAPRAIALEGLLLPEGTSPEGPSPEVMGAGADLKNTFTVTTGDGLAVISQHIGDMENLKSRLFYEETLEKLQSLYRCRPEAVAYDMHPEYYSSKWALESPFKVKTAIQHHYAHIASVMAEEGLREKVVGVAFDGTGYGTDGTLWGGEFLIADLAGFQRGGCIRPFPLPGGERAIREPWRAALSLLNETAGAEAMLYAEKAGILKRHAPEEAEKVLSLCGKRDFSPLSSGAGRVFDAVSSLLGLVDSNSFEAEAAMALEKAARDAPPVENTYPVDVIFKEPMEIDFSVTLLEIVKDIERGLPKEMISAMFHNTVAEAITRVAEKLCLASGVSRVVLSGGTFQNIYLLDRVIDRLKASGLPRVSVNRKVPANDGGISLGQAYILRERLKGV